MKNKKKDQLKRVNLEKKYQLKNLLKRPKKEKKTIKKLKRRKRKKSM